MINELGNIYTRWKVIEFSHIDKHKNVHWLCKCDCGNVKSVLSRNLRKGDSRSCGCLRSEAVKKLASTHSLSNTSEYEIWSGIKQRCNSKGNKSYPSYGGRGIKVCDRWIGKYGICSS